MKLWKTFAVLFALPLIIGLWLIGWTMFYFGSKKPPVADQDTLQRMDEDNKPWVRAWRKKVERTR